MYSCWNQKLIHVKDPITNNYRKVSNIRRTVVGNIIVDHSDVVGASPVGAAPTTSSFSTYTWLQWIGQRQQQGETRNIYVLGLGASYIRELTVPSFHMPWKHSCYIIV